MVGLQLIDKDFGKIRLINNLYCVSGTLPYLLNLMIRMKKALRDSNTAAGCGKAEPKTFAPPQTPFPGAQDGKNLISWRWSLPSPTDPVW